MEGGDSGMIAPSAEELETVQWQPGAFDQAHVLIVDDSPINQMLLQVALAEMGIGKVSTANNGVECLALLDRDEIPDLILLDVMMPVMDGYETCRRIRASDKLRDLTIVFQTALDTPDYRLKAFDAGCTDFVTKPIFMAELIARLRLHLENRLMTRSLKRFRERLTEQLRVASQMQQSLMPGTEGVARILARIGIGFEAFYRPCDELGGDLWQVVEIDDRRTAVMLFDVNGHGLVAAINAFRLHGVAASLSAYMNDPAEWLAAFNRWLARDFQSTVFATGFYGVFDSEQQSFRYAAAGWMPPLMCRAVGEAGMTVERLPSSGAMLGMLPEVDYELRQVPFRAATGCFCTATVWAWTRPATISNRMRCGTPCGTG